MKKKKTFLLDLKLSNRRYINVTISDGYVNGRQYHIRPRSSNFRIFFYQIRSHRDSPPNIPYIDTEEHRQKEKFKLSNKFEYIFDWFAFRFIFLLLLLLFYFPSIPFHTPYSKQKHTDRPIYMKGIK